MIIRYFIEANNAVSSPYHTAIVGYVTRDLDVLNYKCLANAFNTEDEAVIVMSAYIQAVVSGNVPNYSGRHFFEIQKVYIDNENNLI